MKEDAKALSVRQVTVFIFLATIAVKMFMLPSLMAAELGRNAYLAMLAYLAVDFGVLLLVVFTLKRADCDFYTLLERMLGKVFARVVLGVCVLVLLFKLTLMLGEVHLFFEQSVFEAFGWALYIVPLLAFMCFVAVRNLKFLGRTAEIVLPFVLVSIVLLFVLTTGRIEFGNLLPVLKDGGGDITKYSTWLGDYSVLVLFAGKVTRGKAPATRWLIAGAIGALVVETASVLICATYGNLTHLIEIGHNLGSLAPHSGTENYGRLDLFVFTVVVAAVIVKILLYTYAVARHTAFVTTVNKPLLWAAIAASIVYALSVFVFPASVMLYGVATTAPVRIAATVEQFLLPVLTFASTFIPARGKEKTHEKA